MQVAGGLPPTCSGLVSDRHSVAQQAAVMIAIACWHPGPTRDEGEEGNPAGGGGALAQRSQQQCCLIRPQYQGQRASHRPLSAPQFSPTCLDPTGGPPLLVPQARLLPMDAIGVVDAGGAWGRKVDGDTIPFHRGVVPQHKSPGRSPFKGGPRFLRRDGGQFVLVAHLKGPTICWSEPI